MRCAALALPADSSSSPHACETYALPANAGTGTAVNGQMIFPIYNNQAGYTPAKCEVGFRRRDEVLIGTDFAGDGACLTDSGYPRVIRSWRRGTPLESAVTVFEVGQQCAPP